MEPSAANAEIPLMETEQRVLTVFFENHPDDAALILEGFSLLDASRVLQEAPRDTAASVLRRMAPIHGAECLASMEGAAAGDLTARLPLDSAALLLRRMERPAQESLVERLPREVAEPLRLLLRYPDGTAGALMDPCVLSLPDAVKVSEALERVRRSPQHVLYYLYLVDRDQRLAGVLNLRELMLAAPEAQVASVMERQVSRIVSNAEHGVIVSHPGWRRFHALPVVDEAGVFLGAIRYETLRWLEESASRDRRVESPLGTLLTVGEWYWIGLSRLVVGLVSAWAPTPPAPRTAAEEKHEP